MRKLKLFMLLLVLMVGGVKNAWADTALLSGSAGWSKITSMPATPSDYYFVFVDKDNDLMLFYKTGKNQGDNSMTMFYKTSQNPIHDNGNAIDNRWLWEISTNNDGYSIKSAAESTLYIQTENDEPWKCHTHDNGLGDASWYKWKFKYSAESLWTIENGKYSGNYIGPWNAASFTDDSEVAGNKKEANIGHYYIYAIRKIDANILSALTYLEGRTDNTATITSLRTKYTNGTYTNSTTANDVYNDYKALEVSALSSASAADYTSALINPSFETGNLTGWTTIVTNDPTYPFNTTDCNAKPVASYPLTNSDGDYILNYYAWSWSCDPVNGIQQTIKDMPAGNYRIEAVIGGWKDTWEYQLDVNGTYQKKTPGTENEGLSFSVDVALAAKGDLVITAKTYHTNSNTWEICYMKADNFRIYNLDHYYDALNAAITAAETHTLGFDINQYAPYENVAAITALKAAKDVDQSNKNISWSELQTIVSNLTSASWTKNIVEKNAFYRGTLSEYTEDTTSPLDYTPNGWTTSENMRMMLKNVTNYPGLADASATTAMMSWSAGITYGETEGYTMPLAAHTIYELKFKAAGWNNETRSGMTVSVLNSSDGLAATDLGTPDRDIVGNGTNTAGMTSYSKLFKTGAAGNYVFHIQSGHNFVITDFELKRGGITITEDAASAPMTGIANVTLERAFNAGWNAVCLPFATAAFDDAKIADFTGETIDGDNVTLQLTKVDAFEANKPYLVYFPSAVSSGKTFNQVEIESGTIKTSQTVFDFMGTMVMTDIEAGSWVISGGKLKKASTSISLKPTRTYFVPKGSSARIAAFNFDGETPTGITFYESDNQLEFVNEAFNLSGQKINGKLKKGIYIVNGKKTVVK